MNACVRISAYIEELTGSSDAIIHVARPLAEVMGEVAKFVGDYPLVAQNATFDGKFWDAKLANINRSRRQEFAGSLMQSRGAPGR